MRFSRRTRGVSLFELLVVMALLAILLGLAGPSWRSLGEHARSQSVLAGLERALGYARQEALLRRKKLILCASSDQRHCSGSWQEGLLVWIEGEEGEPHLLRVFQFGRGAGLLHWRTFPRGRESCEFLPTGATNHENGTFWYCNPVQPVWALTLGQAGGWRVRYPQRDGRLQDERGLPLPC